MDPRTPVLVGAATCTQRLEGPDALVAAADAVGLMRSAARQAAVQATGSVDILGRVGLVLVPKGIWDHPDPGRQALDGFGARPHSVLAEVGVLQQTLLTRAALAIAEGQADVVLVTGGEDKEHQRQLGRAGRAGRLRRRGAAAPDELWRPDDDILSRMEIERDLAVPAQQYAVVEQALRHAEGRDDQANRERLGRLWAAMAAVAATRPEAWDRSAPSAAEIATPGPGNRLLAEPYTRRLCSQWNVDQSAALLLTSVAEADRRGIDRDRWIFPWRAAESNAMIGLPARAQLHRSPAVRAVGQALLAGLDGLDSLDQIELVDLYSCFPAAVGVQCRELGIDEARTLTLTGGMTFGGGPLNNYGLQSAATLAERLRQAPGTPGLVTSISGMITKHGASVWSTEPPPRPFQAHDVSPQARAATAVVPVDPEATGPGRVAGWTVIAEGGEPVRAVAVIDAASGARTVAVCAEPAAVAELAHGDWGDRAVTLVSPGRFVPH